MQTSKIVTALLLVACCAASTSPEQDWTNRVRIGAYGLNGADAQSIVDQAQKDHVFGIEVDNDIPGRYESLLDPASKLDAIRKVATAAHKAGNYAFVYIAGTECITANADKTGHTLAKEHPDWLQRKKTGEPAIFGSDAAFWITKGDEDVWISPYATEWRKLYMQRVREIAGTGIDGIYVDIPYWMTHFTGWEESWASFDDYTVAAFRKATGLDAKSDIKLNDFSDPGFRKWIEFRISTITEFLRDIDQNAKSVNPKIKLIPEIYPGIEQEAVRVGADVYSLYPAVDAIAHEYEFGEGDHMASSRTPLDWFHYQVGMHSFRAFAQGKATWILNYSWDGDAKANKTEAMKNLAMSQVMAGANFWDAPGHSMAGSNDLATRSVIFDWIARNERTFYTPRKPIAPIGVYFSPASRNLHAEEYLRSYRGVLILLMQKHLEFQIVTPHTLSRFEGSTLVLPNVSEIGSAELIDLQIFAAKGRLVVTGDQKATESLKKDSIVRLPDCPGQRYEESLLKDFSSANPESQQKFFDNLKPSQNIVVEGSSEIASSIAMVEGKPHLFLANFSGLKPHSDGKQQEQVVKIRVRGNIRSAQFLPFLGDAANLRTSRSGGFTVIETPPIAKGAVVSWEP